MKTGKLEYYRDQINEWRWRLVATNGHIVAESGEGYRDKWQAERGWAATKKAFRNPSMKYLAT